MLIAALLVAGCGGGRTAPVEGQVKFKDGSDVSVLAGYEVSFSPEAGKASATGQLDAAGKFQLSTFGNNDGAMPGKYRVAVSPPLPTDPDKPPPKAAIPDRYKDFQTSQLTAEVKPGRNAIELELERRP